MPVIQLGLEVCLANPPPIVREGRLGLLMNQASVDSDFQYACDLVARRFPRQLKAIFSPQHGLWGEQQANMIETANSFHQRLGVPIYSLYSDRRQPTEEMLSNLDCLLVDLQDVGTRVYTFIWTVSHCLEACAKANIPVLILDRPNPVGGELVEGPVLEAGYESFVGRTRIPMRHGLTLGELGLLVAHQLGLDARIEVVAMKGWRRQTMFQETGRTWVLPSPNMPRVQTAMVYPGQVLLEGTNLSEGRGTTLPFEVVGAPFIDPVRLLNELDQTDFPGLNLRPIRFTPTFDKWQQQSCGGIALHIREPHAVRSFRSTVLLIATVKRLWPKDFEWLPPPYEYEYDKMPIDILFGSSRLRERLDECGRLGSENFSNLAAVDAAEWHRQTSAFRLYE